MQLLDRFTRLDYDSLEDFLANYDYTLIIFVIFVGTFYNLTVDYRLLGHIVTSFYIVFNSRFHFIYQMPM